MSDQEAGEKRKAGGQPGNTNSVRHGRRSGRAGVVFTKLGKRFGGAYHDCLRLRKAVEDLVSKHLGGLTLRQRARCQTLARLEMSCRAMELAIRDNPEMPADQLRQIRLAIVQWSLQRDNLIAELLGDDSSGGGGQPGGDPWAFIDAQRAAQRARVGVRSMSDGSGIGPTHSNAGDATGEPLPGKSIGSE